MVTIALDEGHGIACEGKQLGFGKLIWHEVGLEHLSLPWHPDEGKAVTFFEKRAVLIEEEGEDFGGSLAGDFQFRVGLLDFAVD